MSTEASRPGGPGALRAGARGDAAQTRRHEGHTACTDRTRCNTPACTDKNRCYTRRALGVRPDGSTVLGTRVLGMQGLPRKRAGAACVDEHGGKAQAQPSAGAAPAPRGGSPVAASRRAANFGRQAQGSARVQGRPRPREPGGCTQVRGGVDDVRNADGGAGPWAAPARWELSENIMAAGGRCLITHSSELNRILAWMWSGGSRAAGAAPASDAQRVVPAAQDGAGPPAVSGVRRSGAVSLGLRLGWG